MDDGCALVVDEDNNEKERYKCQPDASNESLRTATPLSSHTFGHVDSPNPNHKPSDLDQQHLHPQDATRPSLDSYQSSSPSTAPPTTPTRTLDSLGNTSPASPTSPSTPPLPSTTMDKQPYQQQPTTLRNRREFRIFSSGTGTSADPQPTEPDHRLVGQTSDTDAPANNTLRRTTKRKPRPKLGVATFATSHTHSGSVGGVVVIEPSPLSPVMASPRSNRTAAGTAGGQPVTPSISYIPTQPVPSQALDGMTSVEPMSPDVTLDLPGTQYVFIQEKRRGEDAAVSPFGTTFVQEKRGEPAGTNSNTTGGTTAGGAKLQYKPRRRVPTPRKRSIVGMTPSSSPGLGGRASGSDDAHSHSRHGHAPISYRMHDTMEMGAPPLQDRAHSQSHEGEPEGRRSSLSRWSFSNPGQGVLKRLSRLRSNSDLRTGPAQSVPASADSYIHTVKSAVEPKPGYAARFANHHSNTNVDGASTEGHEYRGYASDGVPKTTDGPNGNGRRRSTGLGGRLSKILPLPFPVRRGSVPYNYHHQQHHYPNGILPRGQAQGQAEESIDAHMWAPGMATNYGSVPAPVGPLARRSIRLSAAGSAHSNEGVPVGSVGHRHSTITVRSSDGWFTTLPSSSVSLSASGVVIGNGSPISATFGGDVSGQNSPLNISKTSLPHAHAQGTPVSAYPQHPGLPYYSASDPATPTLAALGEESGNDGNASRRHSGQPGHITAADLLKSSQRGSLTPMQTRPQSLQHQLPGPPTGTTNNSAKTTPRLSDAPLPPIPTKAELLNGIQHGDSIRLLDVETAAAIRRSIDFEDRVRKGEDVLRRALYGSDSSTPHSQQGAGTSSRTSSFSNGTSGSAVGVTGSPGVPLGRAAAPRGRNAKAMAMAMERSSSTGGASTPGSSAPGSRRSGSVDHVRVGRNGLLTGGGVFLPSAVVSRSPATRYVNLNGSFHSASGSSSGLSATPHTRHEHDGSGSASGLSRTASGGAGGGLNSASGTLTRASSTLREGKEESFGYSNEKYGSAEFGVHPHFHPVPLHGGGAVGTNRGAQHGPTLAKRVGRRISRIFVGKGGSTAA